MDRGTRQTGYYKPVQQQEVYPQEHYPPSTHSVNSTNYWPPASQPYTDDGDDALLQIENESKPPRSWLGCNILITLCCCLPLGIAGIVFSAKTSQANESNDHVSAKKFSKKARDMWISGLVVGLFLNAIIIVFYVLFFRAAMENQSKINP